MLIRSFNTSITCVSFSIVPRAFPVRLVNGRRVEVTVSFSQQNLGVYDDRVELLFEDTALRQKFVIARPIKAIVASPEYRDLQPKAPFVPRKRASRDRELEVVPGDPPPALGAVRYVVPLPHNRIPPYMTKILSSSGSLAATIRQFRGSILPGTLQDTTYGRHFKALLWAEEYRSEWVSDGFFVPDNANSYVYIDKICRSMTFRARSSTVIIHSTSKVFPSLYTSKPLRLF